MLTGDNVYLCEIDPKNIEWMRNQRNKPEMRKFFREWKYITKPQQQRWYDSRGDNSDPRHAFFEIHELSQGKLIGCVSLSSINYYLRSAEFGIFIEQGSHSKGFGKEALSVLFDYGFGEVNLHKIWAEVFGFNKAFDIYTKCLGMKIDGKLRDNAFTGGQYHDSVILSILEDEWKERKK